MVCNNKLRDMATVFLQHCREVREDDAIITPQDDQPNQLDAACEAFKGLLVSLQDGNKGGHKGFIVRGYAALWAIDPQSFGGKNQKQIAQEIGVAPETFNRALAKWSKKLGFIGPAMRPRRSRFEQASKRRKGFVKNFGSSQEVSQ